MPPFGIFFVVSPFLLSPEGPTAELWGPEPHAVGVSRNPSITEELRHRDVWLPWVHRNHTHQESESPHASAENLESPHACAENQSHWCSVRLRSHAEDQNPHAHVHQESESPLTCTKNPSPRMCAQRICITGARCSHACAHYQDPCPPMLRIRVPVHAYAEN